MTTEVICKLACPGGGKANAKQGMAYVRVILVSFQESFPLVLGIETGEEDCVALDAVACGDC